MEKKYKTNYIYIPKIQIFPKKSNPENDIYTVNSAKSNGITYLILSVKMNEKSF